MSARFVLNSVMIMLELHSGRRARRGAPTVRATCMCAERLETHARYESYIYGEKCFLWNIFEVRLCLAIYSLCSVLLVVEIELIKYKGVVQTATSNTKRREYKFRFVFLCLLFSSYIVR